MCTLIDIGYTVKMRLKHEYSGLHKDVTTLEKSKFLIS